MQPESHPTQKLFKLVKQVECWKETATVTIHLNEKALTKVKKIWRRFLGTQSQLFLHTPDSKSKIAAREVRTKRKQQQAIGESSFGRLVQCFLRNMCKIWAARISWAECPLATRHRKKASLQFTRPEKVLP